MAAPLIRSRPRRASAGAAATPREGAEGHVPPGRADAVAVGVVLEVVAHVELAQSPLQAGAGVAVVMQREVEHVVDQIARQEPGAGRPGERRAEHGNEDDQEPVSYTHL